MPAFAPVERTLVAEPYEFVTVGLASCEVVVPAARREVIEVVEAVEVVEVVEMVEVVEVVEVGLAVALAVWPSTRGDAKEKVP